MNEVQFHGAEWAGTFEFTPDGVTVFAAPSDPEAHPHYTALSLDPTPDQADRIAAAWAEWAARCRAGLHRNAQPDLLGLLP